MDEPRAQRTLVKSPPELWAEVSDVAALARHLGEFGEVRITRLEPETTVAWEGDRARGTVILEPSGWGTKVTLTAEISAEAEDDPAPEPVEKLKPVPEPEPEPEPETEKPPLPPAAERRAGLWARLFGRRKRRGVPEAEPEVGAGAEPEPEPAAEPQPVAATEPEPVAVAEQPEPPVKPEPLDDHRATAILSAVLDDLGSAHHRPFSR